MIIVNHFLFPLFTGLILGIFFFAGLNWTIHLGLKSKRPWLVFTLSFFLRTFVVLFAFFLISRGDYKNILLCSLSFTLAKYIIKKKSEKQHAS